MDTNNNWQLRPAAATLSDLLTVPAATEVTISSFVVCNTTAVVDYVRIRVAPLGAVDADSQAQYHDLPIGPKDTFIATIGGTLKATDKVRVYSLNGGVSFTAYGVEHT
jgi:hypothetical protein